ncbi:MAG: hypothetical protein ILO10_06360 [Kiritimatiellae bacterium]|nr:hypothetical protein [Kiritimatiellia bacterium]
MPENDVHPNPPRIDLSKPAPAPSIRLTSPTAPVAPKISVAPAAAAPQISPVAPVAPKAATGPVSLGADDDIYKRRTALLDTSKIPMAGGAPTQSIPRTVKISGRPTIRVGSQSGSTFSPGQSESPASAGGGAKPAIRLKRPNGSLSVSSSSSSSESMPDNFVLSTPQDDEPGAAWAIVALLGLLAAGALIYFQIISMQLVAHS